MVPTLPASHHGRLMVPTLPAPEPPRKADGSHPSCARYGQFAALFDGSCAEGMGQLRFGLQAVGGGTRAYIEQVVSGERYYIYLIWQEAWTSSVGREGFERPV